ncbi:hypothetical protein CDD82_3909 [Ophiocordyceps australis]|uniref:Porphobilinogen deaminase n=1 Tax=Ophiocordyceps australis TaxID=1399860 RepID=A0A2C5Z9D7_9HYPO|nr:hypothetical protein CDD82_3909 [Ophiocordyceps australis]
MAQAPATSSSDDAPTFKVGTRKSPLALAQTDVVVQQLQQLFPKHAFPLHMMTTTGDRDQNTALYNFGGKGLWTSQLEELLVQGDVDLVVHSLKDMPTTLPHGCVLGCVTRRHDPRDTLVIKQSLMDTHGWKTLHDLPPGSVIGTSSVRRIAQLARRYPHLRFCDIRGNIHTRLRKLDDDADMVAIILAAAGLQRMQLGHRISQYLDNDSAGVLHAVGQGALGVECRAADDRVLSALRQIQHAETALACAAERSLMRVLEGGCSVPIGVETSWTGTQLQLKATVVSPSGAEAVDAEASGPVSTTEAAEELGKRVAQELERGGADKILKAINATRSKDESKT